MIIIIILYLISFGLSLLNSGAYWDDWAVLVGKNPIFIKEIFYQMGNFTSPYIYNNMNIIPSYNQYRIVTFLAYFFVGYFAHSILSTIKIINPKIRILIVIFFLLFPANDARNILVIFTYSLCNFFFYLGWWLVSFNIQKNTIIRILSLIVFSFSFTINSFLFFYFIIIAYFLYRNKASVSSRKYFLIFIKQHFDFLLLPFAYYLVKLNLFPAYGVYMDYNQIILVNILTATYKSFIAFASSFLLVIFSSFYSLFNISFVTIIWQAGMKLNLHPYVYSLTVSDLVYLVQEICSISFSKFVENFSLQYISVLFAGITLIYFSVKKSVQIQLTQKIFQENIILFFIGCLLFYMAVFPYYMVNKPPSIIEGFSDRHLLLVPLGASLMIVYGIQIIFYLMKIKSNFILITYSIFITMFITYHIRINIDFMKDWAKQVSLIQQIKKNKIIKSHTTFVFIDNTMDLNVKHRPYEFYEYTGFMKLAYGDEKRFASGIDEFESYNDTHYLSDEKSLTFTKNNGFRNLYDELNNMKDYIERDPEYIFEINYGSFQLTDVNIIYLKYLEFFNKEVYSKEVANIVQLSSIQINNN